MVQDPESREDDVADGTPDVTLREKVAFLGRAEAYAERPRHVESIETHMAWVFLTDSRAYKMKKPVRYELLDFSTLERRRRDCAAELVLNRRLAPDVYLGVVPLVPSAAGELTLGGEGAPIEWLVEMRRLPAEAMLEARLRDGRVADEELRRVAEHLTAFYQTALRIQLGGDEHRRRIRDGIEQTRRELERPGYGLPLARVADVAASMLARLDREPALFDARVRAERIVEAHGDLRPEHVHLGDPPAVIDCLEFNRELRVLDPVSELSFLGLECERLGAAHVGEQLLAHYAGRTGDRPPQRLLRFYRAQHAFVRAKIAIWHLREEEVADPQKWIDKARRYLRLAAQ